MSAGCVDICGVLAGTCNDGHDAHRFKCRDVPPSTELRGTEPQHERMVKHLSTRGSSMEDFGPYWDFPSLADDERTTLNPFLSSCICPSFPAHGRGQRSTTPSLDASGRLPGNFGQLLQSPFPSHTDHENPRINSPHQSQTNKSSQGRNAAGDTFLGVRHSIFDQVWGLGIVSGSLLC